MFNCEEFQNDEINIPELVEKLQSYNDSYYNDDESPISDEEYDRLKDLLKKVDPTNKLLFRIGSPAKVSKWKKAPHKIAMGSLNKVNYVTEFVHWTKQCNANKFLLSVKLDGISIDLEYEKGKLIKAITRGDGLEGEEILSNVIQMKNVNKIIKGFTGSLRGEIVIHRNDFIALNKESEKNGDRIYKNPRNSAGGISKNFDGKYARFCTVLYYDIASKDVDFKNESDKFLYMSHDLELELCNYLVCDSVEDCLQEYENYEEYLREEYPYDLDGLVILVDNIQKQKDLGEAYGNKKGAIAWKFGAVKKETEIINIDWQVGNNGRITPVAIFTPTQLMGSTVEKASIHNIDMYRKLKLGMNDKVIIFKANDVIPQIDSVLEHVGEKFNHPEKCPVCGEETDLDGKFLICPNDNCPALYCGALFKWLDKLEIMDASYSTVENLFNAGLILYPADFYKLTEKQFASLAGLGEKSAKKFLDQLYAKMEIDLSTFIGGLNMANFSSSICEKLMNAGFDTLEKQMNLSLEEMCKVPGIKERIAGRIYNGIRSKKEVIENLLKAGIKIKSTVGKEIAKVSNHLSGKAFVFTGAIEKKNPETDKNYKREELQLMVSERGGINHSSLTKNTTFLVQADINSQSSKTKKAQQYGTKIISEKEFFKMLEG